MDEAELQFVEERFNGDHSDEDVASTARLYGTELLRLARVGWNREQDTLPENCLHAYASASLCRPSVCFDCGEEL